MTGARDECTEVHANTTGQGQARLAYGLMGYANILYCMILLGILW